MKTLHTLAIDDEPLALRVMAEHARRVPFLYLETTTDPIQGLVRAQAGGIDLVLLDVQMAALGGMEFLRLLQGRCAVILTTAYPHYALEGYEHAVVDYLLKPISFERFLKAVQRVEARVSAGNPAAPAGPLAAELPTYSFIKTEHRLVRVNHNDIHYIEGGRDYATVVTSSDRILTLTSLSKLAEGLPQPPFMRVHKSYIVALNKITSVERQRIYLGQKVLPIGDTYREEFARAVGQ